MLSKRIKFLLVTAMLLLTTLQVSSITYAQETTPTPRTADARDTTIAAIQAFAKDDTLGVVFVSTLPGTYNSTQLVEIYEAGGYTYEVDVETNRVVQVAMTASLAESLSLSQETAFTSSELETRARSYIGTHVDATRLQTLTSRFTNKDEKYYFFRWEARTSETQKMPVFIQVGFDRQGVLLSYTNTLDLSLTSASSSLIPDDRYYANNGNYWSSVAWWGTVNGFGYCGNSGVGGGWCSPFNMRYTHPVCGAAQSTATWNNIDFADAAAVRAFIPSNHAWSTRAPYTIRANNQTHTGFVVNQAMYSDQWATVNYEPLDLIQYVVLSDNTCEASTVRIGADEIHLDYTWWNP